MRWLIRGYLFYVMALYVLDKVFPFISILNNKVLLLAAAAFFVLNTVGRPIIKILWLPINIITLGLFSWVIHIVVVVAVTIVVPGFVLTKFSMPTLQLGKLLIQAFELKMLWTYLAFSIMLSLAIGIIKWIFDAEE